MIKIAHIETDFPTKFGIPRQSGLVDSLKGRVVFEPEFRDINALRGIEGYSHLWLIWEFSAVAADDSRKWSPTVRPPRLGGNVRMGVFASRSPFRPNPIGLSCVRLEGIDHDRPDSPVLLVSGADLMDGTPIYDIKPYLPYVDSHPEASGGFALQSSEGMLEVEFPPHLLERIPTDRRDALIEVLAQDPRPQYQSDPERVYGMPFAGADIRFRVNGSTLTVIGVENLSE